MHRLSVLLALLVLLNASAGAHEDWCGYDFTLVGVPNSAGDVAFTSLTGMNSSGKIVGGYTNSNPRNGFLLRGAIFEEKIEAPDSAFNNVRGINDKGVIVGFTVLRNGERLAIHRDSDGRLSTFNVPGATLTDAWAISSNGRIVGHYRGNGGPEHGFLWNGRKFQTIDAPFQPRTALRGVNKAGQIVGNSVANDGRAVVPFLLSDGIFTPIQIPDAFIVEVSGINDRGQIVGTFTTSDPATNPSFSTRSFVSQGDDVTFIDAPFPGTQSTSAFGINNRGELVGTVSFADGRQMGFTAAPRTCK